MNALLRKMCLATAFMAVAGSTVAQDLNSGYFTQDYKYRHDMNAAFGNDQNYFAIPVMGSLNLKMQGNFGIGDLLFKNPENGKYDYTFMHPDVSVSDALSGFNSGKNRISADLGLTILSMGFNSFGGYSTIEVRERTSVAMMLPYELFEFAKNTHNKTYNFDNIGIKAMSFAEVALGHSHQVNDALRIGAKLKMLLGVANAELKIDGMSAVVEGNDWVVTTGDAQAQVSMKGLEFKYTTDEYKGSRGGSYRHIDFGETEVDGAGIGGFGMGIDLGAEYQVMEGLKVSAAINDLGFINWSDDITLKQNKESFHFEGFHDIKLKDTSTTGISIDDQMDDYGDQISDFVSLVETGEKGSRSTMLAATANVGAEYQLPVYKPLTFGLLAQHHFNGKYSWSEGRLSANWAPLNWLDGGVNLAVNSFCTSAGWILNLHPKGINFFIGMDHILGTQSKEFIPLSSNANIAMGINVAWGGGKKNKKEQQSLKKLLDEATQEQPGSDVHLMIK